MPSAPRGVAAGSGRSATSSVSSFHPNKNITTIEGGALVTADAEVLKTVEQLRFHGIQRNADGEPTCARAGGKYNFSDVSACIGIAQLAQLESFNRRRRELAAARYFELLRGAGWPGSLPERGDQDHSWHIFTVLIDYARFGYTRSTLPAAGAA